MILATSIFQGLITQKFPPTNAFLLRGIFFQFLDLGLHSMHARVFLKMFCNCNHWYFEERPFIRHQRDVTWNIVTVPLPPFSNLSFFVLLQYDGYSCPQLLALAYTGTILRPTIHVIWVEHWGEIYILIHINGVGGWPVWDIMFARGTKYQGVYCVWYAVMWQLFWNIPDCPALQSWLSWSMFCFCSFAKS